MVTRVEMGYDWLMRNGGVGEGGADDGRTDGLGTIPAQRSMTHI